MGLISNILFGLGLKKPAKTRRKPQNTYAKLGSSSRSSSYSGRSSYDGWSGSFASDDGGSSGDSCGGGDGGGCD